VLCSDVAFCVAQGELQRLSAPESIATRGTCSLSWHCCVVVCSKSEVHKQERRGKRAQDGGNQRSEEMHHCYPWHATYGLEVDSCLTYDRVFARELVADHRLPCYLNRYCRATAKQRGFVFSNDLTTCDLVVPGQGATTSVEEVSGLQW
jgi:hypothetical protein